MAEQLEDPERVAGPPVRLVAVKDQRRVAADPASRAQVVELFDGQVVARHLVLQVVVPADLDRARDVAHVVKRRIFVGLDDPNLRIVQVFRHPVGRRVPPGERIPTYQSISPALR